MPVWQWILIVACAVIVIAAAIVAATLVSGRAHDRSVRHSRPRSAAVPSPSAAVPAEPGITSFAGKSDHRHSSEAGFESR